MAQLAAPRHLESVPIDDLRRAILAQPPEFWDSDADIKRVQAPRRDGKMVWLWRSVRSEEGLVPTPGSALSLTEFAAPLIAQLLGHYPQGGEVVSAVFALLPAGGRIPTHRDAAPILVRSHRIHIPLVVGDGVEFIVDGETIPLTEGAAFELPNQLPHSVHNRGSADRIHLVFDYHPTRRGRGEKYSWLPRGLS